MKVIREFVSLGFPASRELGMVSGAVPWRPKIRPGSNSGESVIC
jgi:hypothetical protein